MTLTPIEFDIAQIVPHAATMCLLDRALAGDKETIACEVEIRPTSLFNDGAGVGAWVGVEYMAQTVAAWAGWHSRTHGAEPKVGFLLGTRCYNCSQPLFKTGEILRIEARREFQADNGLGQFDCRILIAGNVVATAALTVFEPADADEFLKESGNE